MGNFKRINESRARYEKTQEDTNTKMQAASTKSGINWKKWLVYGATALVAVTVGYYSYKAWYSPQLAETATLTDEEVKAAEKTHLAFLTEAKISELTTTGEVDLFNFLKKEKWDIMKDPSGVVCTMEPTGTGPNAANMLVPITAQKLGNVGITLKEGQDMGKPDFKLDADQLKGFYRNNSRSWFTDDDKTAAALAAKQLKVDAVNYAWTGARNQAIGVAAVPTLAVGLGGYWGYNKWCSKKDEKPADQKPASKKPVDNRRQNTDPNARTNNTAGDRNNTKTDGSKIQVEGGDDTKTNKADQKSGMP